MIVEDLSEFSSRDATITLPGHSVFLHSTIGVKKDSESPPRVDLLEFKGKGEAAYALGRRTCSTGTSLVVVGELLIVRTLVPGYQTVLDAIELKHDQPIELSVEPVPSTQELHLVVDEAEAVVANSVLLVAAIGGIQLPSVAAMQLGERLVTDSDGHLACNLALDDITAVHVLDGNAGAPPWQATVSVRDRDGRNVVVLTQAEP